MMNPSRFPYACMGPCGCDLTGVPRNTNGHLPRALDDGTCDLGMMTEWYGYHFCCTDPAIKHERMKEYMQMYRTHVGPPDTLPSLTTRHSSAILTTPGGGEVE
jgi:hypothetical protein